MGRLTNIERLRIPEEQAQIVMENVFKNSGGTVTLSDLLENNMAKIIDSRLFAKEIYEKFMESGIQLGSYGNFVVQFRKIRKKHIEAQKTNRAEA